VRAWTALIDIEEGFCRFTAVRARQVKIRKSRLSSHFTE